MKKQVLLGLLIISVFCFLTTTSELNTSSANIYFKESYASNVELTIDYGNSTLRVFSSLTGNTVFDVLNQSATVTFTQYFYGKFITTINGVENNANGNGYYWQYWVNEELGPVAADTYVLSDEDQVLWKYCAPEDSSTTPPLTSPELILGLGIIGAVGAIVVIAASLIYLRIR